ncbi:sigma-70 family RNA polymerase sigma factor [Pedobacter sp. AW31-3R]|uniref:sigma-70 family RNA polymerase sigma factor n=1 Tax=Pedobacter sp. AW31-3R TaxID=3445781 RepID=UPI003F9FB354
MQEENKQAIGEIYEKFWKELYLVAFRHLRSEEDVEDILHDIFLSLLTGNIILEKDESIRAFLHMRLKSRIINFHRKQFIQASYKTQESNREEIAHTDSETKLMARELEGLVQEEIDRMPEKMKQIFLLSRNEFLSNEEIANQLNLSNQTVRNQMSSAIKRIRIAVNLYGQDTISPAALHTLITISTLLLIPH